MVNKYEAIGILGCIGLMAIALFFMRLDTVTETLSTTAGNNQTASVVATDDGTSLGETLAGSVQETGELTTVVVDDVTVGDGAEVALGDTVTVHYIGSLQNGEQFDNSYVRGTPFTFTLGEGKVIKGWEEGIVGMKVGGQRILIIPPAFAYGEAGAGPIPPNATLVFAVELLSQE